MSSSRAENSAAQVGCAEHSLCSILTLWQEHGYMGCSAGIIIISVFI